MPRIQITLSSEQLRRVDEIARQDAERMGSNPNRSGTLARLINMEWKRRQKRQREAERGDDVL